MKRKPLSWVAAFSAVGAITIVIPQIVAGADPSKPNSPVAEKIAADHAFRQVGEENIQKELAKPADLKFADEKLIDVIQTIAGRYQLEIQFDEPALNDASIDPAALRVTAEIRGVSLCTALKAILSQVNLTCLVRDEVLMITTAEKANATLITHVYDVRDLVTRLGTNGSDFDSLMNVMTTTIAPTAWDSVGGTGTVQPGPSDTLIVSQTAEVQEEVAGLLAALRKMDEQVKAGKLDASFALNDSAANLAIKQALVGKVNLDFKSTPLAEVVKRLGAQTHVEIQLDLAALKDAAIDPSTLTITQQAKGVTLRSALHLLLQPYQLTHEIRDGMLLVTTADKANWAMGTRLYRIGDLAPVDDKSRGSSARGEVPDEVQSILNLIQSTVAPPTWSDQGGMGVIEIYGLDKTTLVVAQTDEVHEQIDDLLEQLRTVVRKQPAKAREPEVPVLRIYELRTSLPGAPAMTPQEVAEVVKGLVDTKSWTQPEIYIRGVTGKLVVRQLPSVQKEIERLLGELGARPANAANGVEAARGGLGGGGF